MNRCALAWILTLAFVSAEEDVRVFVVDAGEAGVRAFDLEIAETSRVEALVLFPPCAPEEVSCSLKDAVGWMRQFSDPQPEVRRPGTYRLEVACAVEVREPFSVRVVLSPPLDPWEPNDTPSQAARIDLPFRGTIWFEGKGAEPDWFRVRLDRAAILAIQVAGDRGNPPWFRVEDAEGNLLYASGSEADVAGARYVEAKEGEYLIGVSQLGTDEPSSLELSIGAFEPSAVQVKDGGIIALGLGEDDRELAQLRLVARGSGVPILNTIEPTEIAAELVRTAEAPPALPSPPEAVPIRSAPPLPEAEERGSPLLLIAIAAVGAGVVLVLLLRRRGR